MELLLKFFSILIKAIIGQLVAFAFNQVVNKEQKGKTTRQDSAQSSGGSKKI